MEASPQQQPQSDAVANGRRYDYYLAGLPEWKQKLLLPKLEKDLAPSAAVDDGQPGGDDRPASASQFAAAHAPGGGRLRGAAAVDARGLMSSDPVSRADGHVGGELEKNGLPNNRAAATVLPGLARVSGRPRAPSSSSALHASRHWPVVGADRQVSRSDRPTWYRSPDEIVIIESPPHGSDAGSASSFAGSVGRQSSGNGPAFGPRADSQQQPPLSPQPDGCSLRVSIVHQVVSQFEHQQMEAAAAVPPKPPPRRRQSRHQVDGFASPPLSPGTLQPPATPPPALPPRDALVVAPALQPLAPAPVARLGPAPFQIPRREGGAPGSVSGVFAATFVASAAPAAPDKAAPERPSRLLKSAQPNTTVFRDRNSNNAEVLPVRHVGAIDTEIKTLASGQALRQGGHQAHAESASQQPAAARALASSGSAVGSKPALPQARFAWPPVANSAANGPNLGQQVATLSKQEPSLLQQPVLGSTAKASAAELQLSNSSSSSSSGDGNNVANAANDNGGLTPAVGQAAALPAGGKGVTVAGTANEASAFGVVNVSAKPARAVASAGAVLAVADFPAAQPAVKGGGAAAAAEPGSNVVGDRPPQMPPLPSRGGVLPAAGLRSSDGRPAASAAAAAQATASSATPVQPSARAMVPPRLADTTAVAGATTEPATTYTIRPPVPASAAVPPEASVSASGAARAAAVAAAVVPEVSGTSSARAVPTGGTLASVPVQGYLQSSEVGSGSLPVPTAAATAAALSLQPAAVQQMPKVSPAQTPPVTTSTAGMRQVTSSPIVSRQQVAAAPAPAAALARPAAATIAGVQATGGRSSPVASSASAAGSKAAVGFISLSAVTTTSSSTDAPPTASAAAPAAAPAPNTASKTQPDSKAGGAPNEALEFLQALSRRKAAAAAAAAADDERHPETGTGKRVFDTRSAMSKERKVPEYERIFEGGAVVFYNDNVIVANGNLRKAAPSATAAAKPALAVKFHGSHLSRIFEYPSEDSLLLALPKEPGCTYFDDPVVRPAADEEEEPPRPTQFGLLSLDPAVTLEGRPHAGHAHHHLQQPLLAASLSGSSETTNTDC